MSEPQEAVASGLRALGTPAHLIDLAVSALPPQVRGMLVYGSRARGDHLLGSDLDLLGLVPRPARSAHRGDVSMSFYTAEQLRSGIGSLFGAHLARDARILWDPAGDLGELVATMGAVDTSRLIRRAAYFSQVLGAPDRDLPKYLPGLLREARYLLRSCLYAEAIADGAPCFSVRELALRHGEPELVELLTSRPSGEATLSDLNSCSRRLERITGPIPDNPHGSLESLIVNEWGASEELVAMALLALGGSNPSSDYTEVSKVLL